MLSLLEASGMKENLQCCVVLWDFFSSALYSISTRGGLPVGMSLALRPAWLVPWLWVLTRNYGGLWGLADFPPSRLFTPTVEHIRYRLHVSKPSVWASNLGF